MTTDADFLRRACPAGEPTMIFEALSESAERGELYCCHGGLIRYHVRKDLHATVREILVLPQYRRQGLGRLLLGQVLLRPVRSVTARCPQDLPSNGFWRHMGFECVNVERTRTGRLINVWRLDPPCGSSSVRAETLAPRRWPLNTDSGTASAPTPTTTPIPSDP